MSQYILTGYVENALAGAEYDKLEDGTFSGRIPSSIPVISEYDLNKEPTYEAMASM
jgi:hypothetical protein